jgi:hypothetical protein
LSGGAVFALSFAVLGCLNVQGKSVEVAKRYGSADELQPDAVPYKDAFLIFGGKPVATTLTASKKEGGISFRFETSDATLDEENYEFDSTTFRYAGNEGESFDPGIPLLRFPFDVGEDWTWAGTYRLGPEDRKATAVITTVSERLNTVAGEFGTVRSTVELSIESGTDEPVKQKLTFWFAPKHGVVRREFQYGTTREPMPPKEPNDGP